MNQFSKKRGLRCVPVGWIGERPFPHDEEHACRYEVRDERGTAIGIINTDRARRHPNMKWQRSALRDGKLEKLVGKSSTVQEAFSAF